MKDTVFGPAKSIREFDGRKFIGKIATIELQHLSKEKNDQFVIVRNKALDDLDIHISGWVGRVLGKPGVKIRKKIYNLSLIEASNGGRSNYTLYNTYSEFFNNERKEKYCDSLVGGLQYALTHRGDPGRADVAIRFIDFQIVDSAWAFTAPEEWYSDLYKGRPQFRFADGFYPNAATAIEVFAKKNHDDLFGERYFPVIVFPISKADEAKGVASYAKGQSLPIVVGKNIIIGTRCKPHEYPEVIEKTYELGGQVPIGVDWDWQS